MTFSTQTAAPQPQNTLTPAPSAAAPVAYSYVRFSHGRQKKGDSLRRQLALSREYADMQGLNYRS